MPEPDDERLDPLVAEVGDDRGQLAGLVVFLLLVALVDAIRPPTAGLPALVGAALRAVGDEDGGAPLGRVAHRGVRHDLLERLPERRPVRIARRIEDTAEATDRG